MAAKFTHTVPTHLEVKDKVFWGLDFHQFMWLFTGLGLAAFLYNVALLGLPVFLKLAITGLVVAIVLALVLVKPNGDSLSDWLFDRFYYYYSPQAAIYGLVELVELEIETETETNLENSNYY
jgi:hypothetical protein